MWSKSLFLASVIWNILRRLAILQRMHCDTHLTGQKRSSIVVCVFRLVTIEFIMDLLSKFNRCAAISSHATISLKRQTFMMVISIVPLLINYWLMHFKVRTMGKKMNPQISFISLNMFKTYQILIKLSGENDKHSVSVHYILLFSFLITTRH